MNLEENFVTTGKAPEATKQGEFSKGKDIAQAVLNAWVAVNIAHIYLEPIALIGRDVVLTRGRRTTNEGRRSTHNYLLARKLKRLAMAV